MTDAQKKQLVEQSLDWITMRAKRSGVELSTELSLFIAERLDAICEIGRGFGRTEILLEKINELANKAA